MGEFPNTRKTFIVWDIEYSYIHPRIRPQKPLTETLGFGQQQWHGFRLQKKSPQFLLRGFFSSVPTTMSVSSAHVLQT